jgi:hypothetical protein
MSDFVEKAMRKINLMANTEIEELKADFKRVMTLTFEFFGESNFRLSTKQTRGSRINIALLESVCYFFSAKSDSFLKKNKPHIQKNFTQLLKNRSYLEAVRFTTSNRANVINRFKLAQEILGENCETC